MPLAFDCIGSVQLRRSAIIDRFRFDFLISLEIQAPEGFWPPQLVGVLMSLGGMIFGSLLPQVLGKHHRKHA